MLSNRLFALYSLVRSPHWERDKIVRFQNRQLRRVIAHAYENVAYYRRLFDREGLKPQDIRRVQDLSAIPITSKKDLQKVPARELVTRSVNPKRLVVLKTGGSTGEPLVIRRSWFEERLLQAFRWRVMHYYGQRIHDRAVGIAAVEKHDRDYQFVQRFFAATGLHKWTRIECTLPQTEIVRRVQALNPDILRGYPGALHHISQMLRDDGSVPIRPRFVGTGGEVLTPLMRRQIAEVFEAPVFDIYGTYEFNLLAWECKETGELHTCDDSTIVEVLKNGRPVKEGQSGEVVGTCLHSFAMPFIRYRLEDIVTKGAEVCACGQSFSTIRHVQGRMIDYFRLPDGRVIHPFELSDVIYTSSWIRQYRMTQEREDRVVLQVVPRETMPEQEIRKIDRFVRERLGEPVEFRIELVPEIEFEPSGKFRVYRYLVTSD